MRVELNDEDEVLLREIDLSRGIRGKYADRFTPELREAFDRECAYGMVHDLTRYALDQVRDLEGALFTLLVLTPGEPVQPSRPRDVTSLVTRARDAKLMSGALVRRLQSLIAEVEWMQQPREEPYTGPGSFNATLDRLDAIYNEARALREKVDSIVQRHLARSGMSAQEIERKTEETARLWAAA